MESVLHDSLETISQMIKNDLNKLVKLRCQAKCANGKQCKFDALTDSKCCKKHASVTINQRNAPTLIYHNHIPGQIVESCPACQTVGINS